MGTLARAMSDRAGRAASGTSDAEDGAGSPSAFARGNELAERGRLKDAEQAYREADEQGHPTAAAYVGLFAELRGDSETARSAYERSDERPAPPARH